MQLQEDPHTEQLLDLQACGLSRGQQVACVQARGRPDPSRRRALGRDAGGAPVGLIGVKTPGASCGDDPTMSPSTAPDADRARALLGLSPAA